MEFSKINNTILKKKPTILFTLVFNGKVVYIPKLAVLFQFLHRL